MESEFEQRLHESSKEDLIELVRALMLRHPLLRAEAEAILNDLSPFTDLQTEEDDADDADDGDMDEEETDEWDFGGEENTRFAPAAPPALPAPLPLDSEIFRQRLEAYAERLQLGERLSHLAPDLAEVLREAELRAEQQDYYGALDIYALVLDERLHERSPALIPLFDEAINAATPALEALLGEASSNTMFDEHTITLSPLLTAPARQAWLERLFMLWLKRVDAHSIDDELPEIMLSVAWKEDMALLRTLTQNELQKLPRSAHSNILDFTRQFRYRALEKFLKALI
jgi:hypothetical protein